MEKAHNKYKVVIVGESGVGKTSIMLRLMKGTFDEYITSTVGASYFEYNTNLNGKLTDGDKIKLQIWDTAGQERYRALMPLYMRDASAAIIVYDVTSKNDDLQYWTNFVNEKCQQNKKIQIVFVGNKMDLVKEYNKESEHFYTSAKSNTGIKEVFEHIAETLYNSKSEQPESITELLLKIDDKPQQKGYLSTFCRYL